MSDTQPDTETDEQPSELLQRVNELVGEKYELPSATKVGTGTAALGALGVAGAGTAAAAHKDESYSDSDYEDANKLGYGGLTDVEIVRFALILERLEATFYTEAVGGKLDEHDVENSDIAKQLANPSLRYSTFQRLEQVRDHEQAHVTALEGVLKEVGGNPDFASDLEFTFPYENVGEFYDLGQVFEDTGVAAYNGAAASVDTEKYLAAAVQIHAVEARHASYFRTLNNPLPADSGALNPFPEAFQQKLSVSDVAKRVIPFIEGVEEVSQVVSLVKKN
jgi:rubrerythrin